MSSKNASAAGQPNGRDCAEASDGEAVLSPGWSTLPEVHIVGRATAEVDAVESICKDSG